MNIQAVSYVHMRFPVVPLRIVTLKFDVELLITTPISPTRNESLNVTVTVDAPPANDTTSIPCLNVIWALVEIV